MNNIRLSLITVTKDDPAGLARTLASAAAIRLAGVEHLVIDGGSDPEASGRLVAETGGDVTVIGRPARGIADAFNAGISAAQGEWLWFLNGGDQIDARVSPGWLEALLLGTEADVVIGKTTYEGEADPRPHPARELQWPPFRSWIPHPSTLVRRALFARFEGFDERYTIAMDFEWWLRALVPSVQVDVISSPLAVFAPGGVSQRPESRNKLRREKRHALWRHQGKIWRAWFLSCYHLIRASLPALVFHRLDETDHRS